MTDRPAFTYPASLTALAVPPATLLASNPHLTALAAGAFIFAPTAPPRILLLRRAASEPAFPNLWEVPGGGAELSDDTLLAAVAREVFEETALVVTAVAEALGWVEFGGRAGRNVWRKYNFLVEVAERGGGVRTDPVEHDEWGWFKEGEVRALDITTPGQRGCIEGAFARVRELRGEEEEEEGEGEGEEGRRGGGG